MDTGKLLYVELLLLQLTGKVVNCAVWEMITLQL